MKNFHKVLKINDLGAFSVGLPVGVRAKIVPFLWAIIFLVGCGGADRDPSLNDENRGKANISWQEPEDAQRFRIGTFEGGLALEVRSIVGRDTLKKTFEIREPARRVIPLSTASIGFIKRLGLTSKIIAVGTADYIADSALYRRAHGGEPSLPEVGNGPTLSLEKVVNLKPDLVITFATGGSEDDYQRLNTLGIPLMISSEWQEESPLAKAEWIKVYGILLGADTLASTIYRQSKNEYSQWKNAAHSITAQGECPKVIAGMIHGGVWYAPGGNSYTAKLIKDAGGCYLWENDPRRELKFTLEEILALGNEAEIWINPGPYGTPEEILAAEPRVEGLKAWKNQQVFQMDKKKGRSGGNDFYESAVSEPENVLKDLIRTFHPTHLEDYEPKWYRNIFIL